LEEVPHNPLVSIGLPVYNEERFLEKALDSLLSQDYPDLEVIVSDNCSSDRTPTICERYATRDARVRYRQNETNVGAVENFNRVFELVQGKYFMLAGGHDLWDARMISRSVSILEADERVVLAYSGGMFIDFDDQPLDLSMDHFETRGLNARKRYVKVIKNLGTCSSIYGVIRTDALRSCKRPQNIWGPDFCLLGELALKGDFAHISEPMFFRRLIRPEEEGDPERWKRRVLTTLDPEKNSKKAELVPCDLFHELRQSLLKIVWESNLGLTDKLRAHWATLSCFEKRFAVHLPAFLWRIRVPGYLRRTLERHRGSLAKARSGERLEDVRQDE
jgi:glycosyltransferase involved in cell wall biosynthesis